MPYKIDEDIIREIRERNDIVETISQHVTLKRVGSNFVGLCPFHSEKTPSFSVSPSKQMYHCFGCGEGGDVISFIMKYSNLDFVEALKILADKANIVLEDKESSIDHKKENEKNTIFKINKEAARYYFANLKKENRALEYLFNRGINAKTIKVYGLGYSRNSWDDLLTFLKNKGYSLEEIEKAGLIIKHSDGKRYYDRFRGRIMFPIIDTRGRIIGFGGRTINNIQPKYLNSPDTSVFLKGNSLYGLNTAKKYCRDKIILTEGYMDVISLYQYGINYSVASLGTALTQNQSKLLNRYSKEIYICYDSDKAGLKAANRAIDILKKEKIDSKVIILPEGKDPDDFIKENGSEAFIESINNSYSYLDFKIYYYKKIYDLDTLEGRINFTKEISNMIKDFESPIEQDAYIKKISDETNISIDAIRQEISNKQRKQASSISKDKYINTHYRNNNRYNILPVKYNLEQGHLLAEKGLLNFIIHDKEIFLYIKEKIRPGDFLNHVYRRAAEIIYELYDSGEKISKEKITINFEGKELVQIEEVLNIKCDFDTQNKIKMVDDYLKKIYFYQLKIKKNEIKQQIAEIQKNKARTKGDVEKLLRNLTEIDKELKLHQ